MKPSKLVATEQIRGLNAIAAAFDYTAASGDVIQRLDAVGIHLDRRRHSSTASGVEQSEAAITLRER